ncbi:DNA-binding domain-containing protein [Rhizobium calliandrae]|uniref:DNA-binding domain-containing protein n=1 Tax=Rhizobium calliandrae TaxID=1312182 RepID=A0ABT7KDV0_9HYPH|nr:DNA-binding domain-containing protein [Rhizobium calliandrae]MDL2406801.1 DNA-binding domain-containing protein [Rhizobium calliandrae]
MLSNFALQSKIAQAILHCDGCDLAPVLAKGTFDPLRRFNIYRNNMVASLTATLIAVFPVTLQLLGENYFRYIASVFIRNNPPQEARLVRYGSNFAHFLAGFEDTRPMSFIAETARLEWMIAEALDAPALPGCTLDQFDDGEAEAVPELFLQPSLRLFVCRWPALEIWSAHQAGGNTETLARLSRQPERIALWRSSESIRFLRLDARHFAFLHALKKRSSLEAAVGRVLARTPDFDLASAFGALFAEGLVARIRRRKLTTN